MSIQRHSAKPSGIERYYRVRELSGMTGIPIRTIYAAIDRGEIATFKPRGCKRGQRIAESEARRWLAECTN